MSADPRSSVSVARNPSAYPRLSVVLRQKMTAYPSKAAIFGVEIGPIRQQARRSDWISASRRKPPSYANIPRPPKGVADRNHFICARWPSLLQAGIAGSTLSVFAARTARGAILRERCHPAARLASTGGVRAPLYHRRSDSRRTFRARTEGRHFHHVFGIVIDEVQPIFGDVARREDVVLVVFGVH
jgi:hypothetical protein